MNKQIKMKTNTKIKINGCTANVNVNKVSTTGRRRNAALCINKVHHRRKVFGLRQKWMIACTSDTVNTAETQESDTVENTSEEEEEVAQEETEVVEEPIRYKELVESVKVALDGDANELPESLASLINDIETEFDSLYSKAQEVETQLSASQEESSKVKEQYMRLTADFDNFRKRTSTEKESLSQNVQGNTLEELLPVIDNFELARNQLVLETEGEQKVNDSYQGLYKQMVDTFKKIGLETIESVGAKFDPELHDAIMQEETTEHPDDTVLEEFRRGFTFKDRLLRAAMVKVAVNSTEAAADGPEEGQEEEPVIDVESEESPSEE